MAKITIEENESYDFLKDTNKIDIKILAIFERQNSWVRTSSLSFNSQKLLSTNNCILIL